MFTLDEKKVDEKKLSDKGKISLSQIQRIHFKRQELQVDLANLAILEEHYTGVLREEAKKIKEEKKEDTKEK